MAIRLADMFGAGQEGRQVARDDQTRKGLAAYLQGDQAAIGQVYANSPETAFKAEGLVDDRRASAEDRLGKLSTAFAQSKDPAIYQQWRQAAQGVMGPKAAAMPEYLDDPADMEGAVKTATAWAQAYGQGVKQPEPYTLAPGARRFGPDNQLIAEAPFAPQGFKGTWDSNRAMWIPQPGTEGNYGGPTSNPITGTDFGIGETNDYVRKILGKVQLDPNAPVEQQVEAILPHLIQQESAGNPNAVSPKGARGLTQVMPATGRDPGFGVQPLRDESPDENVRFGRDYLTAMMKRYPGRPDLALAAYNAGPGVADRFKDGQASRGGGGLAGIPVAGVAPKGEDAPKPADLATAEMGMRKELDGKIKQDKSVLGMYQNIQNAASNNSAAGDLSLIFAYMKMLDPGSVVREAEFANAQNAAGVPDQIRNVFNKAKSGERLNPNQRADFMRQAKLLADEASNRITAATREYQSTADEYGFDPRRATGMADFRSIQGGGTTAQAPRPDAQPQDAVKTVVRTGTSNGRKVVQYSDGSMAYAD